MPLGTPRYSVLLIMLRSLLCRPVVYPPPPPTGPPPPITTASQPKDTAKTSKSTTNSVQSEEKALEEASEVVVPPQVIIQDFGVGGVGGGHIAFLNEHNDCNYIALICKTVAIVFALYV